MSGHKIIAVAAVVFLLSLFSLAAIAEKSRQIKQELDIDESRTAEREYREELRRFLNQAGYRNCGINMTRTVMLRGTEGKNDKAINNIEYTVLINHSKIARLEMTEASELMTELVNIRIPMKNCTVSYQFMESDY